jgi:hypothetical protein
MKNEGAEWKHPSKKAQYNPEKRPAGLHGGKGHED